MMHQPVDPEDRATDPLWYLLAEETRKKRGRVHRRDQRLMYYEGFLDALEAVRNDDNGMIAELLGVDPGP